MNEQLWGLQQGIMFIHTQEKVRQDMNEPLTDRTMQSLNIIRHVILLWPKRAQPSPSPVQCVEPVKIRTGSRNA
jgi:hypothetical protein